MNHTVNVVFTAGAIIFDDAGQPIQSIRLPFITLFFHLPAALYLWLARLPGRLTRYLSRIAGYLQRATCNLHRETCYLIQLFFTGGVYWRITFA